jgi:hypothetical protein
MRNDRVAFDEFSNGYRVSTVQLGVHAFETMVFPRHSWLDVACERTTTIESALRAHAELVARFEKVAAE